MRSVIYASSGAVLFALLAPAADPKADAVTKEQIESDLKLVPKVFGDTRIIEAGTQPYIDFKLVNTSKTRTHKVVKPGDGSECGWRDPWVHVTAEQRGVDGSWAAMQRLSHGRCGLYDSDWPKDAVELKPGAELALANWYSPDRFEFQYPGKVRLTGHYAYRAVNGKGGKPRLDTERGLMAGVPLFEVRSEPVEFEVVRSFDVRAKVKKALKVGVEMKASEVIEITVTNTSNKRQTVGNISQNGYGVGITPHSENASTIAFKDVPVYGELKFLEPGETATVFGGGDFAGKVDGSWRGIKAGTVRVRVSYSIPTNSSATHVVFVDAEVRVE
ncbi:hypothetical protein J8F10_12500 [Gemmata sp. G18]|uniref:DUF1573 domain-containing protein n=1 Tax=Gemmata palustris TaxID=2822762 RepID=A0ABS5BQV5_9BACT|nr:hypothetical protein [Gemmata palustris]MBP3956103.1 hypothetical protein [Gemmata palustris]